MGVEPWSCTIRYSNEVKNSCMVSANLTRERSFPPNLLADDCGGTLGLISGCLINRKRIAKVGERRARPHFLTSLTRETVLVLLEFRPVSPILGLWT